MLGFTNHSTMEDTMYFPATLNNVGFTINLIISYNEETKPYGENKELYESTRRCIEWIISITNALPVKDQSFFPEEDGDHLYMFYHPVYHLHLNEVVLYLDS